MRVVRLAATTLVLMAGAVGQAQGPQGARAGGAPPAGRGGAPAVAETAPKPLIPNAKAVRSCESLATVALPNTIVEPAAVDPNVPGVCRVTAITTHPGADDQAQRYSRDYNGIVSGTPAINWNRLHPQQLWGPSS